MSIRQRFRRHLASVAALGCVALFVAQGCAFLDLVGVQHDEALFAGAILRPYEYTDSVQLFGRTLPLMLDSYLGCLKAWLYAAVFAVWPPDVYSLRVPALLAAALTVWLFYRLMRRAVGTPAALAACALLATDTIFVLTSVLDWGPVVLQHLLTVLALWLAVRFHQTGQRWRLALAGLACGLALWDKAAFLWMLTGLSAAAALVFRDQIRQALSWRNVAVFAGCLVLGAFPLIRSNWSQPAALADAAGGLSTAHRAQKFAMLSGTLDGSSLFGNLARFEAPPKPAAPEAAVDRVSLTVSQWLGSPRSHFLPWAVAAAILLLPWLWPAPARKPMLFAVAALTVAWLMIAATGRGGATHHVVLLWPLPQMLVGTAAGELARRWRHAGKAVAALVAAVCLSGLAVTSEYLAQMVRCGTSPAWTDASYPLAQFLRKAALSDVRALDWGIVGPLRITGGGRLPVRGFLSIDPGGAVRNPAGLRHLVSSPQNYFVTHVAGSEIFPGRREELAQFARRQGYGEHVRRTIRDRHGRPVFEVLHFLPALPQGSGGPR